jgi:membrane-bound inhibitor of C-type lysozyme
MIPKRYMRFPSAGGIVWVVAAASGGCQASPQLEGPPAAAERVTETPPIVARFDCDTLALTATFHEGRVTLALPDRSVTLRQEVSASGARFTEGPLTFWNRGREATLDINGQKQMCRERQDPGARPRPRPINPPHSKTACEFWFRPSSRRERASSFRPTTAAM